MLVLVILLALIILLAATQATRLSGRCLVVQNKGGGHGTLGFSLCKELRALHPELSVTLLQDKSNPKKEPFASYGELEALGVKIVNTDDVSGDGAKKLASAGDKFDYVVDNWSKNEENAATVIELAKAVGSKQLVFVSSGGMYKGGGVMPCTETSEVKTNDARKIELAVVASQLPYTFVRPQYIYGPKSNKRYLDFFLGRVHRQLPIPLPLHGDQLLSLTHIEDAAQLVALSIGQPQAINQVFNCGTDRYITYSGLCQILHDLAGKDYIIFQSLPTTTNMHRNISYYIILLYAFIPFPPSSPHHSLATTPHHSRTQSRPPKHASSSSTSPSSLTPGTARRCRNFRSVGKLLLSAWTR